MSADVRELIELEVKNSSPNLETGGILIGHFEQGGIIKVTHASGPGPQALHRPSHFLRDTAYCAEILRQCYDKTRADYVGEWHSHVGQLNWPSEGDILTVSGIMNDPDYDFERFAMLIAVKSRGGSPRVKLNAFIATRSVISPVGIHEFRGE